MYIIKRYLGPLRSVLVYIYLFFVGPNWIRPVNGVLCRCKYILTAVPCYIILQFMLVLLLRRTMTSCRPGNVRPVAVRLTAKTETSVHI